MRPAETARSLLSILLAISLVAATVLSPRTAAAAEDPREVTARAHFAKGEYQQALDLFARLFAERNDPIYMRNIGRCYQKLGQPAPAIDAFREYLRRAPSLKPAEKQEVEGFIKEMEDLKASQAALAPPPATATTPPPAAVEPPPTNVDLQPRPLPQSDAPAVAVTTGATPGDRPPIYKRWWFWTAAGAVVVGAIVTGIALSAGSDTNVGNCMGIVDCVRIKN